MSQISPPPQDHSLLFMLTSLEAKVSYLVEAEAKRQELRSKTYTVEEACQQLGMHRNTVAKRAKALGLNTNGEGERKQIRFTGEELEMIRKNDRAVAHISRMHK